MKDLGERFMIDEGLEEIEINKRMRFRDDEAASEQGRRAAYLQRMGTVIKYHEENPDRCEDCLDYLKESCALIKSEHEMMESECKKAGLKIDMFFDRNWKSYFKIWKINCSGKE